MGRKGRAEEGKWEGEEGRGRDKGGITEGRGKERGGTIGSADLSDCCRPKQLLALKQFVRSLAANKDWSVNSSLGESDFISAIRCDLVEFSSRMIK